MRARVFWHKKLGSSSCIHMQTTPPPFPLTEGGGFRRNNRQTARRCWFLDFRAVTLIFLFLALGCAKSKYFRAHQLFVRCVVWDTNL